MSAGKAPLAWRNNNPGNIRFVRTIEWKGQEGEGEGGMVRYRTPALGFRALARQIMTYKERDGINTVRKILTKWAPPNGHANGKSYTQNTEGYISVVAREMQVGPDQPLQVQDWRVMFALARAIADYEDGPNWKWPDATILDGLRDAGFDVPPPPMHATPEAQVAGGVVATGSALALLSEVAPHVPVLAEAARTIGPWGLLVVFAGIAAWLAYRQYARRRDAAA